MGLSIRSLAAIACLTRLPLAYGWGYRLYRPWDYDLDAVNRGDAQIPDDAWPWYDHKVYEGQKTCTPLSKSFEAFIESFSITQFGPSEPSSKGPAVAQVEESGRWKDIVKYVGFWTGSGCEGLPTMIFHFYPAPYTVQSFYMTDVIDFVPGMDTSSDSQLQFGSFAEIPFGDEFFFGELPQGAIAFRATKQADETQPVFRDTFVLVRNAIKVREAGPAAQAWVPSPAWQGTGNPSLEKVTNIELNVPKGVSLAADSGDSKAIGLSNQPKEITSIGGYKKWAPFYRGLPDVPNAEDQIQLQKAIINSLGENNPLGQAVDQNAVNENGLPTEAEQALRQRRAQLTSMLRNYLSSHHNLQNRYLEGLTESYQFEGVDFVNPTGEEGVQDSRHFNSIIQSTRQRALDERDKLWKEHRKEVVKKQRNRIIEKSGLGPK
ncbi:hypothetical protein H072_647 [Dactylellina haptotyla CBS 200.50]|uniref:Uncharacterized protein n=1 Tax=Dactylellina haptotyla (strain CBS 200.50) TaxID=1284197 RepID=S8AWP0_DACHA|nr:hypothetical protein H072_647 [Dactylellina haptotyla CBS 200.50]